LEAAASCVNAAAEVREMPTSQFAGPAGKSQDAEPDKHSRSHPDGHPIQAIAQRATKVLPRILIAPFVD
jgi:hypothetical protein